MTPLSAQSVIHHAGLIIVHGNGQVTTRCVSFSEDQISGTELLQRAGIAWLGSQGAQGAAICALEGEGCPASDCFCHCQGSPCAYWTYFHRAADGAWQYSGVGASGWQVHEGDVDGWVWGDGSMVPPAVSLAEICAPPRQPTPRPTETPVPTMIPTPPSTPTRLPLTIPPSLTASVPQTIATDYPLLASGLTATLSPTVETAPSPLPDYGYFLVLFVGLALGYWGIKRR